MLFAALLLLSSCSSGGINITESTKAPAEETPSPDTDAAESAPELHSEHFYVNSACTECGASEGLRYKLNGDGTASIFNAKGCNSEIIVIASAYEGCPVTEISNGAFKQHTTMRAVVIPETVTVIGSDAFNTAGFLESVKILGDVTYIGNNAFHDCRSLRDIELPDSVEFLGTYAFAFCPELTEFKIPTSLTELPSSAFYLCYSLKRVTMHQGVKKIGAMCFSSCDALTEIVNFPDNLEAIEHDAFPDCAPIRTEYGGCIYIGSPKNPYQAVESMSRPASHAVELHPDTKIIMPLAFWNSALESVTITDNISYIGGGAFLDCRRLESVTMTDSVTYLGSRAFEDCWELTSITLSNNIKDILSESFRGCKKLTAIRLPSATETIGDLAFEECSRLTEVYIPGTLKELSFQGFYYGASMTVYFGGTEAEWRALCGVSSQFDNSKIITSDSVIGG